MADFGRAKREVYRIKLPFSRSDYPALPWKCDQATMINVYFEIQKERHLDHLLSEYSRTSPAYCRLSIFEVKESPVGPFREAYIGLGCRLGILPAVVVAASITDNTKVLAAGIAERGFPNTLRKIELEIDQTQAHATISDDQGQLLEVGLPSLQTIFSRDDSVGVIEGQPPGFRDE